MGNLEKNKAIAKRFMEIWGKGSLDIIDELASPDITVEYPIIPGGIKGAEALKQFFMRRVSSIFGDMDFQVVEEIAEGDKVVLRWNFSVTHIGEWPPGTPATGKRLKWTGVSILRIVDGKVVEERGEEDIFGAFRQLGLFVKPEKK